MDSFLIFFCKINYSFQIINDWLIAEEIPIYETKFKYKILSQDCIKYLQLNWIYYFHFQKYFHLYYRTSSTRVAEYIHLLFFPIYYEADFQRPTTKNNHPSYLVVDIGAYLAHQLDTHFTFYWMPTCWARYDPIKKGKKAKLAPQLESFSTFFFMEDLSFSGQVLPFCLFHLPTTL